MKKLYIGFVNRYFYVVVFYEIISFSRVDVGRLRWEEQTWDFFDYELKGGIILHSTLILKFHKNQLQSFLYTILMLSIHS